MSGAQSQQFAASTQQKTFLLLSNFDATTMTVGDTAIAKPKAKVLFRQELIQGQRPKIAKVDGRKGLTSFFIKVYAHVVASGEYNELVFCVASE